MLTNPPTTYNKRLKPVTPDLDLLQFIGAIDDHLSLLGL